jgi:small subunit ribosomal protein S9
MSDEPEQQTPPDEDGQTQASAEAASQETPANADQSPAEAVGEEPPGESTAEASAPEPQEAAAESQPEPQAEVEPAEPQADAEQPAEPQADAMQGELQADAMQSEPQAEVEPTEPQADAEEGEPAEADERPEPAPREKPAVPGAHLEVDIVPEGVDPLAPDQPADPYAVEDYEEPVVEREPSEDAEELPQPISTAAIDLAAGARYRATGKRKTAIARVILRPGSGTYTVNGRALDEHFPRETLQRNIRQPLETVGYQERMDVVARLHGGGISAQAGALRHGISRALLEADPNLRGELKRRGFLTRDSRAKERKKAGLKKARKRPQFSKR